LPRSQQPQPNLTWQLAKQIRQLLKGPFKETSQNQQEEESRGEEKRAEESKKKERDQKVAGGCTI
jgi:hypothetical protein